MKKMEKDAILKELNNIFIDVFDDDSLVISFDTTANDIELWDSLEQINIIMQCEKNWNMRFNIDEISKLKKVGDMVDMIYNKLMCK